MADLTAFERRILFHLEQRGPTHRLDLVLSLYPADSFLTRSANMKAASALIFGGWSKRISKARLIEAVRRDDGQYLHHRITPAGRDALRSAPPPEEGRP